MSYGKGHTSGAKRHRRKPRRSTTDRYKATGEAIAAKLSTMTQAEMVGLKEKSNENDRSY